MKKQQIIVFLLIGICAGLFVSACASVANGNVIIPGNTSMGANVKFQQMQAPSQTLNFTAKNVVFEAQTLAARQVETLTQSSVEKSLDMYASTMVITHHCDGDFAP